MFSTQSAKDSLKGMDDGDYYGQFRGKSQSRDSSEFIVPEQFRRASYRDRNSDSYSEEPGDKSLVSVL
jgi:hypothetical protein